MVSVSGVRGRVGEGLTPEVIARFAAAFGAYALRRGPGKTVVLGRDSRVSGPMFARAATAALQSVGCDVVDVGIAPTPTVQLAVEDLHAAGGLAVTASHNPIEWNALKFIGPTGMFLDGEEGAEMRAFLEGEIPRALWSDLGQWRTDEGAVQRHLDRILAIPFLNVDAIRARRFHVALDCVRGAGGTMFPQLLEALGCTVTAINMETDGLFPREPEPVAENLKELEELVRTSGADIGLATDPDVDRLSLVSGEGRAIGEDYTLALASTLVVRHRPGPLVTNLSTSRLMDDVAERAGVPLVRAAVGEINVARRMQTGGATIGGEGNGGVILPDVHLTRDAPVAAALILQLLAETGQPLHELAAELGRYEIVKEKVPRPSQPLDAVYDALTKQFPDADADRQDGLRLSWAAEKKWAHLRPSGTEPIVRIICEAPTRADASALVETLRAALPK
ncbi:phosphoglucosamine mutase [Longimicrobium terrae]|nr:phosphoglucosamine mutase [Longimicrobium terrae]NNC32150.1 phosphoglucosamine mutase [Longimicrobium terrae]